MRRELLIAEFLSTPWALQHERLRACIGVVGSWAHALPRAMEDDEIGESREQRMARRQEAARAGGGMIAVLPMYGVISQRGNMVDDISGPGAMSCELFARNFKNLIADDTVGSILIDIDSPGGSVYGVQELADEILGARGKKPVVGIANSLAASAAYWLGSACSELYVTPGGEVGSIGVWSAHEDYSKFLEAKGIKTTLISAGKFKTEGNAYGPLDEQAATFMKSRVEDYYGAFTKAVAKGRGVAIASVRDGMGQGRVLGAQAALTEKMVDGVMTFDDVLRKMSRDLQAARANKASARELRDRNDF